MPYPTNIRFAWDLLRGTVRKFFADNGPFLASGLAFDLLLYCIPLSLLAFSTVGYIIAGSERALAEVHAVLQQLLPESEHAFTDRALPSFPPHALSLLSETT